MTYLLPQTPSGGGITLQGAWKFSTNTAATDPGNKSFKINTGSLAAATNIYINETTDNNADASNILGVLAQGNRIYIQQQDDSSRAALFEISGAPVDNGSWWTIPVTVVSSLTIWQNNRTCGFVLDLSAAGGGAAPQFAIKASDESVTNSAVMQDDDDLQVTLDANGIYEIEIMLIAFGDTVSNGGQVVTLVEADGTWNGLAIGDFDMGTIASTFAMDENNAVINTLNGSFNAGENLVYNFKILAIAGGAGGVFKVQWAQWIPNVVSTDMLTGSWIRATKLN